MSVRTELRAGIQAGDFETVERLLADHPAALRHVTGLAYHQDSELRRAAARAVALAARHHPKKVGEIVRRLVWAMGDESGTNATFAPETLAIIAAEAPELFLPVLPELLQLTGTSEDLREGLSETLRTVAAGCTGEVGKRIAAEINQSRMRASGGHRGA